MVELNEDVLETARRQGESLLADDYLMLVEENHPDDESGVERSVVAAYAERLGDDSEASFDAGTLLNSVDDRLTDAETWKDDDAFYEVGPDRISVFPRRWHDELADSTDLRRYVSVIGETVTTPDTEPGVRRQQVIDVAAVIGGMDRDEARDRIHELRQRGELASAADQNPDANVFLPEEEP